VSGEVNRLIALIRRGAGSLKINDPRPWLKNYEAIRSQSLKKDLKHKRVGILTQMEVNYLSTHYPEASQAYLKFEELYKQADLTFAHNLQKHINDVAQATARVESVANDIVQQRIRVLYPSQKGPRAKARKTPIRELIDNLDGASYIANFNPALVASKPKFTIAEHILENLEKEPEETYKLLIKQYSTYIQTIQDESYRTECLNWFQASLASRFNT
jgi:hypothetical protein